MEDEQNTTTTDQSVNQEVAEEKSKSETTRIIADRIEAKERELDARELKLQEEKRDFERLVKATELSGRSFAAKEETQEDKIKREANKFANVLGRSF